MKYMMLLFLSLFLISCWKPYGGGYNAQPQQKVWGSKPVYTAEHEAKQILYDPHKNPLIQAGNIYAFGKYIFQVDVGRGIHVIDNTTPSASDRIGFITVKGCEQISIRGTYLYTNSYADLVTLDISNPLNMREVNRVSNAFPEFQYNYPLVQPEESGYYECPRYDSVVVGWVKDSVYMNCFKN
ncbi:MAG: hypothetical protein ABI691_22060 [Ginsengibacter sp.]